MPKLKKELKKTETKSVKRRKKIQKPVFMEEPTEASGLVMRNGVKVERLPKHDKEIARGKVTLA